MFLFRGLNYHHASNSICSNIRQQVFWKCVRSTTLLSHFVLLKAYYRLTSLMTSKRHEVFNARTDRLRRGVNDSQAKSLLRNLRLIQEERTGQFVIGAVVDHFSNISLSERTQSVSEFLNTFSHRQKWTYWVTCNSGDVTGNKARVLGNLPVEWDCGRNCSPTYPGYSLFSDAPPSRGSVFLLPVLRAQKKKTSEKEKRAVGQAHAANGQKRQSCRQPCPLFRPFSAGSKREEGNRLAHTSWASSTASSTTRAAGK